MSEIYAAFPILFSPTGIALMLLGTSLGIVVGAMPGLTGAMLIALSLPLTFSMSGEYALVLLVSMYVGAISGGLITATLLRIPGTPASMMTTYDGYPLAAAGHGHRALALGIFASFGGGIISWFFLVMISAPLAKLSLQLGPFEFFALVVVAMVLIISVSGRSLAKGMLSGFLGILFAMPGSSPASGTPRWTMGITELNDGLKLLPVLIGLFAINQIVAQLFESETKAASTQKVQGSLLLNLSDAMRHGVNVIRSSLIGTFVGILPGVGANIGSVVAYSAAKGVSKQPEQFGHGSEEGIVASEAANNATVGGALVPLIAMGIPGSVIDAVLLGAMTVHGLQPGPMLIVNDHRVVGVIMGTMLLANVFMFVFMLATAKWISRLTRVPRSLLVPIVLVLCVVGSFALANRMFDVWVMIGMGAIGFAMDRAGIPLAPFVIGFVLAPIGEQHISEGLMQSGNSWQPLFTRPIALVFLLAALATLAFSLYRRRSQPEA